MREHGTLNFVLIGAKATGKTVYLASLYLNTKEVTSKNEHTIEYLKPLAESLSQGKYPNATAGNLHELKFNYKDKNYSCQIQIDDVDGYFVETMHEKDSATQKQRDTLIKNIKSSEGIIFFFPYEEKFNEESIKNFNYEIDTIISHIKEMYSHKQSIPIPAVIGISKWDKSNYFKAENEVEKAKEYIQTHAFLKRAKDKIENNFDNLKVMPLSAVGRQTNSIDSYGLEKPLQYFLKETYDIWDKKIIEYQDNDKELFMFISSIYFDVKFYKNGKYNKIWDKLEKEFSKKLISESSKITTIKGFEEFKNKNRKILERILPENRKKIDDKEETLSSSIGKKRFWKYAIFIVILGIIGFKVFQWYQTTQNIKNEAELYSDIEVAFKNNSYADAARDILVYKTEYDETFNSDHKNKVEEMKDTITSYYKNKFEEIKKEKSLVKLHEDLSTLYAETEGFSGFVDIENKYETINKLYQKYKQILKHKSSDNLQKISVDLNSLSAYDFLEIHKLREKFVQEILSKSNNIAKDSSLDNTDQINTLLKAMETLGINNPIVINQLIAKKDAIELDISFNELLTDIEHKNLNDTLSKVESSWNTKFDETQTNTIKNILDKKVNIYIEKKLKRISDIHDIDEYNSLIKILKNINRLKDVASIEMIGYAPTFNDKNINDLDEKSKIQRQFDGIIRDGISFVDISFGAEYKENDPLGFECGGNDEGIILKIGDYTYHYDDKIECSKNTIFWSGNSNIFESTDYIIDVEEYDYATPNEQYGSDIRLSENELIKIYNGGYVEKDIGHSYFVGFGKK